MSENDLEQLFFHLRSYITAGETQAEMAERYMHICYLLREPLATTPFDSDSE